MSNMLVKIATAVALAAAGPVGGLIGLAVVMSDDEPKKVDEKFKSDVTARVHEKEVEAEADKRMSKHAG